MEQAVYCVSFRDGGWTIRLNGKRFGPFQSREEALAAAIASADQALSSGVPAHVLVRDEQFYRTVWTNGNERVQTAA